MDQASGTVLDFFNTVEDPRQRGKVLYRLDEILLIALAGCLAGADNMVEMAGWARINLEALRSIRPFARGVPSHDTLNDVVNALDPGTFEECFETWIGAIRRAGSDRDRRQDLEADRRPPHWTAPAAHPVGLRARAAPRAGPGGRGRQVERACPDPLAARQAAPQGLAGDDRRSRQLSTDRRADCRGGSRLPADGKGQPAQAAGRDPGGARAGGAGDGAKL